MSTNEDLDRAAIIANKCAGEPSDPTSPGRSARVIAAALSEERHRTVERDRRVDLLRAIDRYLDDVLLWDSRTYTQERFDRTAAVMAIAIIGRCASYAPGCKAHAAIEATLRNIGFIPPTTPEDPADAHD